MSITAAAPAHAGVARPRLGKALLRREFTGTFVAFVLVVVPVSIGVAWSAHGDSGSAGPPILGRILQRFDIAVLYCAALLLALRMAVVTTDDHRDGWLSVVFVSGVRRWLYGPLLALGAWSTAAAIFTVNAVAFAVGAFAVSGTAELVAALPRTLGGGMLFLATHGIYAAMFGLAVRNVVATLIALALVWLVPFIVTMTAVSADTSLPMWIHYYAQATPLAVPPSDAFGVVRGIAFLVVCGALTALISQRVAGRRT